MFTDFRKGIAETGGWPDDLPKTFREHTEEVFERINELIEENREDIVWERIKNIGILIAINDDRETDLRIPKEYLITLDFYDRNQDISFSYHRYFSFSHPLFLQKKYALEYKKGGWEQCKKSHFQKWQMLWLASYLPSILKKSRIPCKYLHDEEHLFFIEFTRSARWSLG